MKNYMLRAFVASLLLCFISISSALSVSPKFIATNEPIWITVYLDSKDVYNLNNLPPILRIGKSFSPPCKQAFIKEWRQWLCDIPQTKSLGLQKVSLWNSENKSDISFDDIFILDNDAAYLVYSKLSTSNDMIAGRYYDIKFEKWAESLISENDTKKLIDYSKNLTNDINNELRRSLLYYPKSAELFRSMTEIQMDGYKEKIPIECKNPVTKIQPDVNKIYKTYIPSNGEEKIFGESLVSSAPTRDPDIGNGDIAYQNTDGRFSYDAFPVKNAIINDVLGINNNNLTHYNVADKILVMILDTYDSTSDVDNFKMFDDSINSYINYHGKIIYKQISELSGLPNSSIVGLNVCDGFNGTCQIERVIDGICRAAYEATINGKSVLVNMSMSTLLGGGYLKDAIRFARAAGVHFIVAGGNSDKCGSLEGDEKCHQYPADWSGDNDYYEGYYYATPGRIISVGALNINYTNKSYQSLSQYSRIATDNESEMTIYAPGEYWSKVGNNVYFKRFGTSFAAPYVTGIIARWWISENGYLGALPCNMEKRETFIKLQSIIYSDKPCY